MAVAVTRPSAKTCRLKPENQAKFVELKGYIESLAKGQAGIYECGPGKEPEKSTEEGSKHPLLPQNDVTSLRA